MNFYVVGDSHGDTGWMMDIIRAAGANGIDTLYQVGDFGIWPGMGGAKYLDKVSKCAVENDVEVFVVLGNHENYDQIDAWEKDDRRSGLDGMIRVRPNLRIVGNKANAWERGGVTFGACGGAISIDREYREPHVSYWPQEYTSERDIDGLASAMF